MTTRDDVDDVKRQAYKDAAEAWLEKHIQVHFEDRQADGTGSHEASQRAPQALETWSAATIVPSELPMREFLLGNVFARGFCSSLFAEGGIGKTTLRVTQALAVASGREITGERVYYDDCRVLFICFEDDKAELDRRVGAAMLHHAITPGDIGDRLQLTVLAHQDGKLMVIDPDTGQPAEGPLKAVLETTIIAGEFDLVILDPLKKLHAVEENSNDHMDAVIQILTNMASKLNVAIDVPHHVSKGPSDPGNANRGRGASAIKDALRISYTMTEMTSQEAKGLSIPEQERRNYRRVDTAKVNIVPPVWTAQWFRMVSVDIRNGPPENPSDGDRVQAIEPWVPPDPVSAISGPQQKRILLEIRDGLDGGERYTNAPSATTRCVSRAFQMHIPEMTPAEARRVVSVWIKNNIVRLGDYDSKNDRKKRTGLFVSELADLAEKEDA